MTTSHRLPFTVPGATPTTLADLMPAHITSRRPADVAPGGLPSRELHPQMQQYLESEPPRVPWWDYPGVRGHLNRLRWLSPETVDALWTLAGRTDEATLAEVAARYHLRPARLLRLYQRADQEICCFLSHVMEDASMPAKPRTTVATLMQRKAFSLRSLADQSGLCVSTVWRAAHGQPIQPSSKHALAQALGLPPEKINWQPPAA